MSITQKVFSSRALNVDANTYVGEAGRLFYAQTTGTGIAPVLKYSDGFTAGGLPLSGSSLTFSSDTPPNNPHDGLLWWNTTDGRLYIYYDSTWVDASPDIQGAVTEIIAGPGISVNTSTGAVTITAIGGTGYTGSQGGIGYTGSVGSAPIGYTGSVGENSIVPGYTGSTGETGYTGSVGEVSTVPGYTGSVGELGYTGSAGLGNLPADANGILYDDGLGNLSWIGIGDFQGPPGPQGPAGIASFTPDIGITGYLNTGTGNLSISADGIQAVYGTENRVIVTTGTGQTVTLSTPQDLNTTATVQFGDLTVNNLNVLNTITNLIPNTIEGYRLYLASTSTIDSQINGGGIVLGTSTWQTGLLYSLPNDYWYTMNNSGFQTEHFVATISTVTSLTVLDKGTFGFVNEDLTLANAYVQINASSNSFEQLVIINHYTGTNASADIVATNDIGDDTTGYIDMGINSSVYSTSSWVVNGANDGYMFVAGGGVAIGTDTDSKDIRFVVGSFDTTDSVIATIDTSGINTDTINSLNSSTLDLNLGGSIAVTQLNVPVGSIINQSTATVYTLANLTLTNVVSYSTTSTDALSTGTYWLTENGIPAPWALYRFASIPNPALQVGDVIVGAGIPIEPVPTSVLSVGVGTYSNYVIGSSDYSIYGINPVLPIEGITVAVGRKIVNANLSIATIPNTDILLNTGPGGNIIVNKDLLPLTQNSQSLGSPLRRWRDLYLGSNSIYILDETLGTDMVMTAQGGSFNILGTSGLKVGEFEFIDNTIKIIDNARDMIVGTTTATGSVVFNRAIRVNTPGGGDSFNVTRDGRTLINTSVTLDPTQSALTINGTSSGLNQPRNFSGTMLQITGQDNTSTRVSIDSFGTGSYPVIAGRQAGGSVTTASNTVAGDTLLRFSAQGFGDTGYVSSIARINLQAVENFTDYTGGTRIRFQTTPPGSLSIQTVSADITATGLSLVDNPIGGITFRDRSFQITAWTTSTNVYWTQIQGAPSVTGYTGSAGANGSDGYTGSAGTNGYSGSNGADGYTGSQGGTGYVGSEGGLGYTGSRGSDGTSVNIKGSTSTASTSTFQAIDPSPTLGDGYIAEDTGHLWIYTSAGIYYGFTDVGQIQGPQGSTGGQGYTGSKGDTGGTGFIGSKGDTGGTGFVGSKGDTGATGFVGSKGDTGFIGSQGQQGGQGDLGYTGSFGLRGFTGSIGNTGGIGYTGSQGIQGITGLVGYTGSQGVIGLTGLTGYVGSQGVGYVGSAGVNGVTSITAGTGTQVSTSTGAVTVWFNTSTLVTTAVTAGTVTTAAQPAITSVGTLTSLTVSGSITDSIGNVRSITIRNTATSYVLTAADNGQMVSITTGSVTINSGIFASPFGQTISIYNNSTTSMGILAGSGVTLRLAGTLSTGTRTLARYGVATTICVSSNTFVVSGAGLS